MSIKIALAGNPNCGKTTLFNALTGSNQYVGNWPGVTVEKKEGKFKADKEVSITDLPGIYSLSPYTLEEVVARNYLIGERPDVILNIIDGTNLERNLYLTTQLVELGIPVVIAINMMDVVQKNGDHIDTQALSKHLGCKVIEISALKGTGVQQAAEAAVQAAEQAAAMPQHRFSGVVEHARILKKQPCMKCRRSSSVGTPSNCSSAMKKYLSSLCSHNRCATISKPTFRQSNKNWTTMQKASSPTSVTLTFPAFSRVTIRKNTVA